MDDAGMPWGAPEVDGWASGPGSGEPLPDVADVRAVRDVPKVPDVPGFELGELIARGGTSEVWAGVAVADGRRVAVKVVHAGIGAVEAAAREASVSAQVASAHVVPVEGCVELADGRLAVVMPHLRGGSLDRLVRARGHLAPGEVVTVLAPVASALGRLHDLGVVHGDVSPGNVLLDLEGRPLLGDLGLGHVLGEVSPGVWGTEGYVAPEVLLGADPGPASDVYGIGALGWWCLTGSVPGAPGLRPRLGDVSLAGPGAEPLVRVLDTALDPHAASRPGAHELASSLFHVAPAQPLDLVRGGDEVSAVTYRLRAAAGREEGGAGPTGRLARAADALRRRTPVRRASEVGSTAAQRSAPTGAWRERRAPTSRRRPDRGPGPDLVEVSRGRGRHGRPHVGGRLARVGVRVVGPAALVAALVGVLVLAVAALGPWDGLAQARSSGQGGESVPVREVSAGSAPAVPRTGRSVTGPAHAPDDPRADPSAPTTRPAALLQALADARASAWREATASMLHAVDAPGSAAAVRDTAAVTDLARSGLRYTGLRYVVGEAETVSASAEAAVVRARIDTGAYAVAGPAGSTARVAAPGEPVLVDLVRTDVGWRVSDLRPVP